MAKKDTFLALVRRGIDETTSTHLAESGLKVGDLKKISKEQLVQNYGLKPKIAASVIEAVAKGPTSSSKQRYLSTVLSEQRPQDKVKEVRLKREQKNILNKLQEERERLKQARIEKFRAAKVVLSRLGKTIELIVKLENNFDDEVKEDQRSKIRDQLETRGLEAARDHEALALPGTPQEIADFRRRLAPIRCFHACPECGDDIIPSQSLNPDDNGGWSLICWECGTIIDSVMSKLVEERLENDHVIVIEPGSEPRNQIPLRPSAPVSSVEDMVLAESQRTKASADKLTEEALADDQAGGLMSVDDWIDQALEAKGYIQSQEDREEFIIRTGAGATKFNKWLRRAGLVFNKQTGRWTRYEDR